MKKTIFLIAAFVFAAAIAHAQTEKGSQTLGINLGFSYSKTSGTSINTSDNSITDVASKYTNFNIGPSYSYFIADKLDIGADLSYNQNHYNYPSVANSLQRQSINTYGGMVYLRKYFMFKDKIGLRGGPYLGYSRTTNKLFYDGPNTIYDQSNKLDNYNAGMRLDLVYYPTKHLGFSAILANLAYSHVKADEGNQGSSSSDNVNLGFINNNLSISVFYVFGSK